MLTTIFMFCSFHQTTSHCKRMGCYCDWKWHRRLYTQIHLYFACQHLGNFQLIMTGMSSAALLSKAGLKVLVLERHGKCGGACHIFKAEGYEFDVGIHYIGDFTKPSLERTLLEQISDGQVQWAKMGTWNILWCLISLRFVTFRFWFYRQQL